jgi:FdhD protein
VTELKKVRINRISEHHRELCFDVVVSEVEVVIRLNGENYKTLFCLPTHLEELAKGHLISEGICGSSDIKGIEIKRNEGSFAIAVTIDKHNPVRMERVSSEAKVTTAKIWNAMKNLDESSVLFRKTGGTQVAGIDSQQNRIFVEDVSRHCAIDKVIGLAFDNDVDIANSALITSCRQTESTVKKAIHAQIPIVISTSAPTSLALEVAKNFGITLIGFVRGHRFNIYSHEWRVIDNE